MNSSGNSIAVLAVMLCSAATIECAIGYTRRYPRLFASLIFFALTWAILLPYYGLQALAIKSTIMSEIRSFLPAYSGVLLLLAAGALRREAEARQPARNDIPIRTPDTFALRALYLLVLPHVMPFVGQPIDKILVIILNVLLTIVGFVAIARALKALSKINEPKMVPLRWLLSLTAIVYIGIEIVYSISRLYDLEAPMSEPFKWLFAIGKLAYSAIFLLIVCQYAERLRTTEERRHEQDYRVKPAVANP